MEPKLENKLEAVLLYDQLPELQEDDMAATLTALTECGPVSFHATQFQDPPTYYHFYGADISLQVSHTREPLGPEGFGSALSSPYTGQLFPDAGAAVSGHQAHIFITFTKGVPLPESELFDEIGYEKETLSPAEFNYCVELLKALVAAYASRRPPLAIHWVQSDQLLSSALFDGFSQTTGGLPLLVHPSLFGSGEVINGSQVVGMRTYGAANLIGKEIIFDETPVSYMFCYERLLMFVAMALQSGAVIPHGETFGKDESEIILVRHEAADGDPDDVIRLTLVRSDEHNYSVSEDEPASAEKPSLFGRLFGKRLH